MKLYYAYGSWYDGGTDIGFFTTRAKAICAIYDFLVLEQYKHTCCVVEYTLNEYLRELRQSQRGGKYYSSKEKECVFEIKFFRRKKGSIIEYELREDMKGLYNKWKEGMWNDL